MSDELARRHTETLRETLGDPGRLIALSKTDYRDRHPAHVPIFNANVCLQAGKIWWGDLDLTLDEPKLLTLAGRPHLLLRPVDRAGREWQPALPPSRTTPGPGMSGPSVPHPSGGTGRAQPPGVRARRHPPNRLHGWVFRQHQVWVDKHGNEHEIESMPPTYVENVIRFCQRRAEPIKLLTALDMYLEGLDACLAEERSEESRALFLEALSVCFLDARDVLERTPVMRALRARLEERRASWEGAP